MEDSESGDVAGAGAVSSGDKVADADEGRGGGGIGSGSSLRAALTIERLPLDGLRPNNFSVSDRPKLLADEGDGDFAGCGFGGKVRLLAMGGGRFDLYPDSLTDDGRRKCVDCPPNTADSAAEAC
jgi:hypothetical protein